MYKKLNSFKKPIAAIKIYPEKNSRTSLVVQGMGGPPANAGDTGLITGPGRVHMPQSNSAHESAHNYGACVPRDCAPKKRSQHHEKPHATVKSSSHPTHRNERKPILTKKERKQQTPRAAKTK